MRYYAIKITDPASGSLVQAPGFEGAFQNATYASVSNGQNLPGAWNVELDVPVVPFATPMGGARVVVWGVSLQEIGQANDLNGKGIQVFGGFQKGLPLANPAQAGLLVDGTILQAFGNAIGTERTLEMIVVPGSPGSDGKGGGTGSPATPKNIVLSWKAGKPLGDAVVQALKTAFPGFTATSKASSRLVRTNDQIGYYSSVSELAQFAKTASLSIIKDQGYAGLDVLVQQKAFGVYDGTGGAGTTSTPKQIEYTDLIGQPTWIESPSIQFKTAMRANVSVGDTVKLPPTVVANSAAANSYLLNQRLNFAGNFIVSVVRHLGNFRQPNAESWVTVFNAYPEKLNAAGGAT